MMCVVHGEPRHVGVDENKTFALPADDGTLSTLEPASDSSNTSSEEFHHKKYSWRNSPKAVTHPDCTIVSTKAPSRASSHAVTHARTKVPKPLLPIKAVRAMNCVHAKAQHQVVLAERSVTPPRSALKQSSSSSSSSEQKKVHFGNLEMRNYAIVLGDHPDCSSGPPVSIGWEYSPAETVSIDKYESTKPRRRSMDQLELNYFVRKRMLRRHVGVSDEEMRESIENVRRIQRQRMQTKRLQPLYKMREASLSVTDQLSKSLSLGHQSSKNDC